jgi:membrane protease YdiL (CAAX protease family)
MPPWGYLHCAGIAAVTWLLGSAGTWLFERVHFIPVREPIIWFPRGDWGLLPEGQNIRLLARDAASALGFLALLAALFALRRVSWRELGFRGLRRRLSVGLALGLFTAFLLHRLYWLYHHPGPGIRWSINPLDPVGYLLTSEGGFPMAITTGGRLPPLFLSTRGGLVVVAATAVILLPLLEETFFRGLLYRRLRARNGAVPSALVSAAAFGCLYFFKLHGPVFPFTFFLAGLLSAWLVERSGSLYPAILASGIRNAVAIAALMIEFSQ